MKTILKMSCREFALFAFACFGLLPGAQAVTRHRTDAILTSPQPKGATRLVLSPPELEIQELVGIRCFRIPRVTSTPELAPEHWLSTTRITTPQLALEHCCST